jgi:hypothetical protein
MKRFSRVSRHRLRRDDASAVGRHRGAETVVRKLFSFSLGGVDEMSGYAIAIGAPLAFAVALVEQSHIRINILHMQMPPRLQAALNLMAALRWGRWRCSCSSSPGARWARRGFTSRSPRRLGPRR